MIYIKNIPKAILKFSSIIYFSIKYINKHEINLAQKSFTYDIQVVLKIPRNLKFIFNFLRFIWSKSFIFLVIVKMLKTNSKMRFGIKSDMATGQDKFRNKMLTANSIT